MSTPATKGLSVQAIVEEGLALADEVGMDKLSMRKLATRMDVTPMALYKHVKNSQQLRGMIVAKAFEEVDSFPIPGERWDDTVRRTTASIHQMQLRHAGVKFAPSDMLGWTEGMERHTQRVLALHMAQGIPQETLAKFWSIIDAYLTGFLGNRLAELEWAREQEEASEGQRKSAKRAKTGTDAPDADTAAGELETAENWRDIPQSAYTDETFRSGIEIIIAGIAAASNGESDNWVTPGE